jgi:Periplasmic protein involved in polysaccharide export
MKHTFILLFFVSILLSSCKTPQNIVYFQGMEDLSEQQLQAMNQIHRPKISIDDALVINVTSPTPATAAAYNPPPYAHYMPGEYEIGISAETKNLYTYLVHENGCINFPVLGRVELAGLTINEAIIKMEGLLKDAVPDVLVNIQIANFKIRVIGEVLNPDEYTIKDMRVSILDAIAKAGDLTILGNRQRVWLYRDNNGQKERYLIDLTDPAIFALPYYYLQQNDVVYVEPNASQKRNSLYSEANSFRVTVFSTILTTVATASALVISIINVTRK